MNATTLMEYSNDVLAVILVAAMFVGYHLYLRSLMRRDASIVLSSAATQARTAWVDTMMSDPGNGVLAVQTLRNSTMSASFLASTAILLMVGALTLTGQAKSLGDTWQFLNVFGTLAPALWLTKLLCILLLLFYAFFNFVNALRVNNHVGYMIAIKKAPGKAYFSPAMVASELNHGSEYFAAGVRSFYHLVPLVFWLFGPLYMVLATGVLVFILLPRVDRTTLEFRQHTTSTANAQSQ